MVRTGLCNHSRGIDRRGAVRYHYVAGWSSLVARWAHNPKVEGSNPSPATNSFFSSYSTLSPSRSEHKCIQLPPCSTFKRVGLVTAHWVSPELRRVDNWLTNQF